MPPLLGKIQAPMAKTKRQDGLSPCSIPRMTCNTRSKEEERAKGQNHSQPPPALAKVLTDPSKEDPCNAVQGGARL